MAQQIKVVIFDCDGTLVDSERITLGVLGVPTLRPLVDRRKATRRPDVRSLQDLDARWDLLEFEVASVVEPLFGIPTGRLSTIDPLPTPMNMREFAFEGMSRINGQEYDVDRIDFTIPFEQTELWRFVTAGNG